MERVIMESLGDAGKGEALAPTASTGITAAIREPLYGPHKGIKAKAVFFTVESYPVRFWFDGTVPTATTGHKIDPGQSYTITGVNNVRNLRFIDTAAGASSVVLTVFF